MILQPQHAGGLVAVAPRQPVLRRAVRGGHQGALLLRSSRVPGAERVPAVTRGALTEAAVVVLRVRRWLRVAQVRQSAQSFQDPSHEIPEGAQRFPPHEPPLFVFLLLSLRRFGFHRLFPRLALLAGIHGSAAGPERDGMEGVKECTCLPGLSAPPPHTSAPRTHRLNTTKVQDEYFSSDVRGVCCQQSNPPPPLPSGGLHFLIKLGFGDFNPT